MATLIKSGLNLLADIFYPKYCFGCQKPGSYLCKFCMSQVPNQKEQVCIVCKTKSAGGETHKSCRAAMLPDRLICAFPYRYPVVADMIITGKYYFIPEVYAVLGALAAERLYLSGATIPSLPPNCVVTSIPLHPSRLKWRGFNQSEVAAKTISVGLSIPYFPLLSRIKKTKTQKDLNAQDRKTNMLNAFESHRIDPGSRLTVLLVDDVATTGQTFLDASRALKQAGAAEVWCISIAKD